MAEESESCRAGLKEVPVITNAHMGRAAGGLVSTAPGPGAKTGATEGEGVADAEANNSENAEPEPD